MGTTDRHSMQSTVYLPATCCEPFCGSCPQESEISLIDLWHILIARKNIIFGVTVTFVIASIFYVWFSAPVYKAEAIILPPVDSDIHALKVQGLQGADINAAYATLKRHLESKSVQKYFFEHYGLIEQIDIEQSNDSSREIAFQHFSKMISVDSDKKNKEKIIFSIKWTDPELAAKWVNLYLALCDRKAITQLVDNVRNANDIRVRRLEQIIAVKRENAKQIRNDRIAMLKEAVSIAKSMNLNDRVDTILDGVSTPSIPLYYRGTKALSEEIAVLQQRKSDDPFIPGLRDLQEERALIRSAIIDESKLHAMAVDQAAYSPMQYVGPKRYLIVAFSLTLGLLLGTFGALFGGFLEGYQKKEKSVAK